MTAPDAWLGSRRCRLEEVTATSVPSVPDHLRCVTPAITCSPCADAIDFYVRAFGAEVVFPLELQFYGDARYREP